ncbi:MAG: alpha/beta hydrolase [Candidatus Hydrogenedentes bacterium]|nr:alpha/beta hydrolase [Candidatus Hydrogenedentota bacterium]
MFRSVLLAGGLSYGGLVFLGYFFQEKIIFPAPREIYRTPTDKGWPFDDVSLSVDGETTHGWFIPKDAARGTVLFSHGNGENVADGLELVPVYRELGFNVLLYDYGGYGKSTGAPSERRCNDDIRAMWKYLTETRGLGAESVVLHGRSLGGGPTTRLAAEIAPACVVLESTFRSLPSMARLRFPFLPAGLILRHKFDNEANITRITAPLLVIHSPDDGVIPFAQGRALFDRATSKQKEFLEIHGDHNEGFFVSMKAYTDGLKKFLDTVVPDSGRPGQ